MVTHAETGARWPVVDIGRLGLVVEVDRALAQDTSFPCAISDPEASDIGPLDGRVAHCRLLLGAPGTPPRYLAGISFGTPSAAVRAQLDTLLARIGVATPQDRS